MASLRPAYKVEELLALRDSVSESAVSLDKFGNEDAIKEHVLKPSASNPVFGTSTRTSLPCATTDVVAFDENNLPVTANGKTSSPTISLKRSKAQRLLKEHGSPPGIRVTAGGRIVPTDFTPLGSPRYIPPYLSRTSGANSYQAMSTHFADATASNCLPNGFVAYNIEGQLCQCINGVLYPLQITAQGPIMYMPSPNYPFPSLPAAVSVYGPPSVASYPSSNHFASPATMPASIISIGPASSDVSNFDVDLHIRLLQQDYDRISHEKIEHERREVKIKDKLSLHDREQMINRKRQYITQLDQIRKSIKRLEASKSSGTHATEMFPPVQPQGMDHSQGEHHMLQSVNGHLEIPNWQHQNDNRYPWAGAFDSQIPNNLANNDSRTEDHAAQTVAQFPTRRDSMSPEADHRYVANTVETAHQPPMTQTDASEAQVPQPMSSKRSHAVPIRDPRTVGTSTGGLDPTSPVYQPGRQYTSMSNSQSKMASEQDHAGQNVPTTNNLASEHQIPSTNNVNAGTNLPHVSKTSSSSATTTDFFPINTMEHSYTKYLTQMVPKRSLSLGEELAIAQLHATRPSQSAQITRSGNSSASRLSALASQMEAAAQSGIRTTPVQYRSHDNHREKSRSNDSVVTGIEIQPGAVTGSRFSSAQRKPQRALHQETSFDTNEEKNDYFDGYRAGAAGEAPRPTRAAAYLSGYCDGLMKARASGSKRSLSTVSLKSENITPNNTHCHPDNGTSSRSNSGGWAAIEHRASPYPGLEHTRASLLSASRENIRHISGQLNYTPTREQPWHPAYHSSPGPESSRRNNGFEQRVLSGNIHTFAPTPVRVSPGIVTTGLQAQLVNPATLSGILERKVVDPPTSLASRSSHRQPLAEHSGNFSLANNERSVPGSKWMQTERSILRLEEYHQLRSESKTISFPGRSSSGHVLSLSYDGAMDDLQEMVEPAPQSHSPRANAGNAASGSQQHNQNRSSVNSSPSKTTRAGVGTTVTRMPTSPSDSPNSPSKCSPGRLSISPRKQDIKDGLRKVFSGGSSSGHKAKSYSESDSQARVDHIKADPKAPRGSPAKQKWTDKWTAKLTALKAEEEDEVAKYRQEHPTPRG